MSISQPAPGVVGPFAGLDVPGLLRMRSRTRCEHPFLIWAPFEAPARIWAYGEFHERVGALAAGLTGSAADRSALFASFTATSARSDFSRSCIIGFGSSPSRCGPWGHCAIGQT